LSVPFDSWDLKKAARPQLANFDPILGIASQRERLQVLSPILPQPATGSAPRPATLDAAAEFFILPLPGEGDLLREFRHK
jgi:hypothetical protein